MCQADIRLVLPALKTKLHVVMLRGNFGLALLVLEEVINFIHEV